LRRQVVGHDIHVVGEVLPGAGDPPDHRLAAQAPLGAHLAGDAGDLGGERAELVDHRVEGILIGGESCRDVDGDLAGRVPVATAVVPSAMFRTCDVRLSAMELTLSVRSFHVPATPLTWAWPPSLPSVPTSRATRVTSEANEPSWSTIVLKVF